jgi:hypothetical protein
MAKSRFKDAQAKRERGGFVAMPYMVLRSPAFTSLSAHAVKLLFDLLAQYNGKNNGDLCAAWKPMKVRGWKSRDTLDKAKGELEAKHFIERTRQGGRNIPTLYAATFFAIDDCGGKLDVKPTATPTGAWHQNGALLPILPPLKIKSSNTPNVPTKGELTRRAC